MVALYNYTATRPDELSLHAGEVIEVVSTEGDWWSGYIGDTHGAFPSNYVEVLHGGRQLTGYNPAASAQQAAGQRALVSSHL